MKIIVDKMPENPLECIFSRINTGVRRCVHNAKICPLTRGEECRFLTIKVEAEPEIVEQPEEVDSVPEQKKRTSKRAPAKKVSKGE